MMKDEMLFGTEKDFHKLDDSALEDAIQERLAKQSCLNERMGEAAIAKRNVEARMQRIERALRIVRYEGSLLWHIAEDRRNR